MEKSTKKKHRKTKIRIQEEMESPATDPMGSYTGIVTDEDGNPIFANPVQDADDL